MMSFTHRWSEIKIHRVFSGNELDGICSYMAAWAYLAKSLLIFFDDDA